ncbi:MAG: succinate dehydrogenase hydrophobic membrane anchor subunit, partial [Thermoplasmata archaeon]
NPWWLAFMIIFVWVITYHGVNGLTHIIEDTNVSPSAKRIFGILLMVLYVATSIYGTALAIVVARMPI